MISGIAGMVAMDMALKLQRNNRSGRWSGSNSVNEIKSPGAEIAQRMQSELYAEYMRAMSPYLDKPE